MPVSRNARAFALRPESASAAAAPRLHYRRLEPHEVRLLNDLYNAYYRKHRPLEEAVWLYTANPGGKAVIYAACDENGMLAGMRPSIPFRVWWRGGERTAYEFADALVDTPHQGRGIFSRLVRTTCEWAAQEGHPLFSLPNENSLAVYRRNAALEVLGDSCTVAQPLAWLPYLRHHLGRDARGHEPAAPPSTVGDGTLRLVRVERFDCGFGEIEDALRERGLSFTRRSAEFLQWRYFGSPVRRYHAAFVEEAGAVRGYLVVRMIDGIAHIVDFFVHPDADLARRSFRLAAQWARAMRAIGIHFSSAGTPLFADAAASAGYWLKKRSRRLVVNRAGIELPGPVPQSRLALEELYLVMGDFDFF